MYEVRVNVAVLRSCQGSPPERELLEYRPEGGGE